LTAVRRRSGRPQHSTGRRGAEPFLESWIRCEGSERSLTRVRYDLRVTLASGVVLRIDAKRCHVEIDGREHALSLRGRLFEHAGRRSRPVAVGDRVGVRFDDDGGVIEVVEPRRTKLVRARGEAGEEQVLAANISLVLVTAGIVEPPFQPELVDRILAVAEREKIEAVLAITKVDLDREGTAAHWADLYRGLGYRVFTTSVTEGVRTEDALTELRDLLHHNTTVLSGASGVGKSSLINALCPGLDLRVGDMSRILKGRHTTSYTRLIALPGGGHVLDTPGIGSFFLFGTDQQEVQFLFREIKAMVGSCEYRNCLHRVEPGCAIYAAAEAGTIDPQRYLSYLSILEQLDDK